MNRILPTLVLLLCPATCLWALDVGDPAPRFKTGEWIKGEPVPGLATGKIHLIEFATTRLQAAYRTEQSLSQLQETFQDDGVCVMAVYPGEQDKEEVKAYVRERGAKMTYPAAFDSVDDDGRPVLATTWLEASGRAATPLVFLIDRTGRIAWIGPTEELTPFMVLGLIDGSFDPKWERQRQLDREEVGRLEDELMAWVDKMAIPEHTEMVRAQFEKAAQSRHPRIAEMARGLMLEMHAVRRDWDAFHREARRQAVAANDNPELLHELASRFVHAGPGVPVDLDLAESWALDAVQKSNRHNPVYLRGLAEVNVCQGRLKDADKVMAEAIALAGDEQDMYRALRFFHLKGEIPTRMQVDAKVKEIRRQRPAPAPVGVDI